MYKVLGHFCLGLDEVFLYGSNDAVKYKLTHIVRDSNSFNSKNKKSINTIIHKYKFDNPKQAFDEFTKTVNKITFSLTIDQLLNFQQKTSGYQNVQ